MYEVYLKSSGLNIPCNKETHNLIAKNLKKIVQNFSSCVHCQYKCKCRFSLFFELGFQSYLISRITCKFMFTLFKSVIQWSGPTINAEQHNIILQMMGWPRDMGGSCEYTEEAIVDCQQEAIPQLGVYGEIPLPHCQTSILRTSILRSVFTMPWVGSSEQRFIRGGKFLD